jgi:hypothetical protein
MKASRRLLLVASAILTPLLIVAALLIANGSDTAKASSHREAPAISKDPFADNTDTYVFIPQGQTDRIVLLANWIPFEAPEGGPNYWEWDDSVRYNIHVDINGDATSDITYTLSSRVEVLNPNTFLYNTGPITSLDDADWNRRQRITVTEYFTPGFQPGAARAPTDHITVLVDDELTAPVNIGSKSTPDYAALRAQAIRSVTATNGDMVHVYGGQADDSFWVDLQVFDLLTLRGQAPPIGYSMGNNHPVDSLSGYNVHTLAIEVPISRLVRDDEPVIGVWATSQRGTMPVMNAGGGGELAQVSRLGMPLVNEVVIPMGLKDIFNTLRPEQDLSVYNLLQESVENPEVGTLLCALYGVPLPRDGNNDCNTEYTEGTPRTGRADIFDIFLQGMVLAQPFTINTANGPMELPAGFNVNRPDGVQPSEMIRINTAISGDLCSPTPSRLGILGGDACGYPNGRRLVDDTVEISLLAVAGAAYETLAGADPNFEFNADLIGVLSDNVNGNDVPFTPTFPYVGIAQSGQEHIHQNPPMSPTSLSFGALTLEARHAPWLHVMAALGSLGIVGTLAWLRQRRLGS